MLDQQYNEEMYHVKCHVVIMGVQCRHTLDHVALDSYYSFPIASNYQTLWPTINMTQSTIVHPFELVMHTTWHIGFQNCRLFASPLVYVLRLVKYIYYMHLIPNYVCEVHAFMGVQLICLIVLLLMIFMSLFITFGDR